MKNAVAWLLFAIALALGGCATTQELASTTIKGRIVDRITGAPIANATLRFVYPGPTRDWTKAANGTLFMDPLDAGAVRSDSDGWFTARIEGRTVKKPVFDAWHPFPNIIVTAAGYHTWQRSDLDLHTEYWRAYNSAPATPWPFFEPFVIRLSRQ